MLINCLIKFNCDTSDRIGDIVNDRNWMCSEPLLCSIVSDNLVHRHVSEEIVFQFWITVTADNSG